jgi:hypothetical protein
MSTTDRRLTDEEIRRIVASYPAPAKKVKPEAAKPMLRLAASREREPDERVASVPLEPEDVEIVREALVGRSVKIGPDEVRFDKITNARVTMCWTSSMSPTSPPLVRDRVIDRAGRAAFAYDPYSRERLLGYRGDDE